MTLGHIQPLSIRHRFPCFRIQQSVFTQRTLSHFYAVLTVKSVTRITLP
jgi:hypothetical protein